jgi:hypothetical protein
MHPSVFSLSLLFTSSSEGWVLVQLDHLLDDLIFRSVEMRIIFEITRLISALFSSPLLLSGIKISLELTIVLANNTFSRIIEAISDIVCSFRNFFSAEYIIDFEGLSFWPQTLQLYLGVESSVLYRAVVPLFVLELKIIVEEVLSVDQLAAVPFSNVFSLKYLNI